MTNLELNALFQDVFAFLKNEYTFRVVKEKLNANADLLYVNDTTGVKIVFSNREAYCFIYLYKLVEGKLIENPSNIYMNSKLYAYMLDDIVALRNPSRLIRPAYMYGEDSKFHNEENGFRLYLEEFARNLKIYADDVLRGDFKIFPKLEKVVKERAERFRQGKP